MCARLLTDPRAVRVSCSSALRPAATALPPARELVLALVLAPKPDQELTPHVVPTRVPTA